MDTTQQTVANMALIAHLLFLTKGYSTINAVEQPMTMVILCIMLCTLLACFCKQLSNMLDDLGPHGFFWEPTKKYNPTTFWVYDHTKLAMHGYSYFSTWNWQILHLHAAPGDQSKIGKCKHIGNVAEQLVVPLLFLHVFLHGVTNYARFSNVNCLWLQREVGCNSSCLRAMLDSRCLKSMSHSLLVLGTLFVLW